jgi:hypothetical protein
VLRYLTALVVLLVTVGGSGFAVAQHRSAPEPSLSGDSELVAARYEIAPMASNHLVVSSSDRFGSASDLLIETAPDFEALVREPGDTDALLAQQVPTRDDGLLPAASAAHEEASDTLAQVAEPDALPSAPTVPVVNAGSAQVEPLIQLAGFQLTMPFRTQKDGSRFQGSNCGPAAMAMVLDAFGISQTVSDLRTEMHTYQGTLGMRTGTALQHVAAVGEDYGLRAIDLYENGSFKRWTVQEVEAQLRQGRPVVPLVKYRLLPTHEDSTIRFDHYIVIYGMANGRFLFHDPSWEFADKGAALWISAAQLDAAMAPALEPRQAVAFDPGRFASLPVTPIG